MGQRTPRNFDGTKNPGKKIQDLLPEILSSIERSKGDDAPAVYRFWSTLLGEQMAPLTEPVSFKEGVLTVKVKSATLYSLLCQHEKARLLKRLQEKFSVRNILFRIG